MTGRATVSTAAVAKVVSSWLNAFVLISSSVSRTRRATAEPAVKLCIS
jgi:hypothetical protein